MPKPYPMEYRGDVVRVARSRERGQSPKQVAADFGISESCLTNWLRVADVEYGVKPGVSADEVRENREFASGSGCWSRRTRFCVVRRPTCHRRVCRENDLPARPGAGL